MRVVLADDSMLLREGLARLLAEAGRQIVGKAADASQLLALVAQTLPDVAIVDIKMPPTHTDEGIAAARQIRHSHSIVGVLVLSQYLAIEAANPSTRKSLPAIGPTRAARYARTTVAIVNGCCIRPVG